MNGSFRTATRVAIVTGSMLAAAVTAQSAENMSRMPDAVSAVFAGGCFWCVEAAFEQVDGVTSATSGFMGGRLADPTYEQVSAGGTGHYEVVKVEFDPSRVGYAKLLDVFWHNIDPLDAGGQFCDRGEQYRSAIFYENDEQKRLAEQSKEDLVGAQRLNKPIVTPIIAATTFYPAEEYHQDYYRKNPLRYRYYRTSCGRDRRLVQVWGADAPSQSH